MLEAHINGISEALANLTERGAIDPVVKATVALSDSGFVSVKEVYAFAEVKDDSLTGMNLSCSFISCRHFLITLSLQVN
jgi:hypoxia up-regulated 1